MLVGSGRRQDGARERETVPGSAGSSSLGDVGDQRPGNPPPPSIGAGGKARQKQAGPSGRRCPRRASSGVGLRRDWEAPRTRVRGDPPAEPHRDAAHPASPSRLHRTRRRFWGGKGFSATSSSGVLMPVLFPRQLQIPRKCQRTRQPAFNQQEVTELRPQGADGGARVCVTIILNFFSFAQPLLLSPVRPLKASFVRFASCTQGLIP